jgi:thioredoxin reductase (NADPH)
MKHINSIVLLSCVLIFFSGCLQSNKNADREKLLASFDISKVVFDEQTTPVLILGAGMTGLSAAIYCVQGLIPCIILEGPKPGGALSQSHSVRNWPGVLDAPGADIIKSLKKQIDDPSVSILQDEVVSVDFSVWPRIVRAKDQNQNIKQYKALTVIIGMGTEPNYLGVPGETGKDGYWGRGVGNCAACDGSLYGGKAVVIVGGGDASMTEAAYLADIAQKVIILVRKDNFRASDIRKRDSVLARPNVEVKFNTEINEILGDQTKVTGLKLYDNKNNSYSQIPIDGVFLAIGSKPNTSFFKGQLDLDERGFIKKGYYQETSVLGVFSGGDVSDPEFVQAMTASSDGCKAALQAIKFLKDIGFELAKAKPNLHKPGETSHAEQKKEIRSIETSQSQDTDSVREISSRSDFENLVLRSKKPVLLDIYSAWCVPCQQMMPIIHELANNFKDTVSVYKFNITNREFFADDLTSLVNGPQIQSVPTFLFIMNGKEVGRHVGAAEKTTLETKFRSAFNF